MAKIALKKTASKAAAKEKIAAATVGITPKYFIERLKEHQSAIELEKIQRYFKSGEGEYSAGDTLGGWIREAGKRDQKQLIAFLNAYASVMPRTMLHYAIEHFDKKTREYYLSMKKTT